jgi:hypothetical protein
VNCDRDPKLIITAISISASSGLSFGSSITNSRPSGTKNLVPKFGDGMEMTVKSYLSESRSAKPRVFPGVSFQGHFAPVSFNFPASTCGTSRKS